MTEKYELSAADLAAMIAEAIGEDVDPSRDFYEAGGHSLLIVQILRQLRARGWILDPREFARDSSIASLARAATSISANQ